MPYIGRKERAVVDDLPVRVAGTGADAGQLTYIIYRVCLNYLGQTFRFLNVCTAIGALVCATLELYRRKAGPYEDKKIQENGDVYTGDVYDGEDEEP